MEVVLERSWSCFQKNNIDSRLDLSLYNKITLLSPLPLSKLLQLQALNPPQTLTDITHVISVKVREHQPSFPVKLPARVISKLP